MCFHSQSATGSTPPSQGAKPPRCRGERDRSRFCGTSWGKASASAVLSGKTWTAKLERNWGNTSVSGGKASALPWGARPKSVLWHIVGQSLRVRRPFRKDLDRKIDAHGPAVPVIQLPDVHEGALRRVHRYDFVDALHHAYRLEPLAGPPRLPRWLSSPMGAPCTPGSESPAPPRE